MGHLRWTAVSDEGSTSVFSRDCDSVKPLEKCRPILVYTMTSGLGDFMVLGDLIRKIEKRIPGSHCLIIHRDNPHVRLWPGSDGATRFFSIPSMKELNRFRRCLAAYRKSGHTVFGLQMAPGSLQGFLLYRFLKKCGLLDYIVDFNLINADIITPPKGDYILDLHLNQVAELLQIDFPQECYHLELPIQSTLHYEKLHESQRFIGIHPWSRRGHLSSFVWPFDKWMKLIQHILSEYPLCLVKIIGRDRSFGAFKDFLLENIGASKERLVFAYSNSVGELVDTIEGLDSLITVNTAVVHIGYALRKQMFILNGPSLDLWVPKGRNIHAIRDKKALFQASDKWEEDGNFGSISRIDVDDVLEAFSAHMTKD